MKQEKLIRVWADSHKLLRDARQLIVRHPSTCRNAKRGNLRQQFAKATFFAAEANLLRELRACGLTLAVETPQEPRVLVVLNPVPKVAGSENTEASVSDIAINLTVEYRLS